MGNAITEQAVWLLHGNVAQLSCGNLSGRLDTARPQAGLYGVKLPDAHRAIALLGVYRADVADMKSWPLVPAEVYLRGHDLVASYKPTSDWPFSPQLYWRANSLQMVDGVLASASLLVSVQTHLLDTYPHIGVASQLASGETFLVSVSDGAQSRVEPIQQLQRIGATNQDVCIVSRFEDSSLSYVEVMQSGDFREITLRPDSEGSSVEWELFADFLEKGVIRRARVHAALLPRERDLELAKACCAAIDRLELPLTT